jgi:hypothetical protein
LPIPCLFTQFFKINFSPFMVLACVSRTRLGYATKNHSLTFLLGITTKPLPKNMCRNMYKFSKKTVQTRKKETKRGNFWVSIFTPFYWGLQHKLLLLNKTQPLRISRLRRLRAIRWKVVSRATVFFRVWRLGQQVGREIRRSKKNRGSMWVRSNILT